MVIAWRWGLAALTLLTAGCGTGDGCAALSDEDAKKLAMEKMLDSFGRHRRDDMLGPYTADQLRAVRVERQNYGSDQMNNITVQFHGPSQRHVINARIFSDCEIEWRPQLESEYERQSRPEPAPGK